MDMNNVKRASSAGYRMAPFERSNGTRPTPTQTPDRPRDATGETCVVDMKDPVKQDQVWKERVWRAKRGLKEWEKNWGSLSNYDQMGQLKSEEPLPGYKSLFSDTCPNTTSQMFGSRLSTPLGREVARLDRLSFWPGSHHKRQQDPEMLPC